MTVLRTAAEVEVSPLFMGKNTEKRKEDDMAKDHGPSIKDDEQYEALRRQGESKEKAARITNAGSRRSTGRKGGKAGRYEDRSKDDLLRKARQVGIEGRSKMSKQELISALRNH